MTARELRMKRASILEEAQAILDQADTAKREISAEERSQFDGLMTQAANMQADIERREKLEGLRGELRESATQTGMNSLIGLSNHEIQRYSIVRAIRAMADHLSGKRDALSEAGLEMEASAAVAAKLGREARGFFVPYDVQLGGAELRDVEKGGTASGAQLIATSKLSDSFIEMLRNRMMCRAAGALVMGGLVGDISIPRQTGGATAYWVAENNAPTESNPTVGQLALSPKTVGAWTDITRKMLKQSSIDVEMFVRNDLASTVAIALDYSALNGSGSASNEPTGIANTSGINLYYAGGASGSSVNANGAAPVWADIVNLETGVATANADVEMLGYMVNAKVRGKLKQTAIGTNQPMIWSPGATTLNGYAAWVTSQVRSDMSKGGASNLSQLFFGNWADLIFALWGGLDVLVDPYTSSNTGAVRVNVFQDADIGVRHALSFSYIADAACG